MVNRISPIRKQVKRRPTLREMVLVCCLIGFGMMFLACESESFAILWLPGLLLPSFVVFIHACIHLPERRWSVGLWLIFVPPFLLLIGFFIISQPLLLVYYAGTPDTFAVDLKIPKDIPLTDARDNRLGNRPTSRPVSDFDMTEYGQPGMYRADIRIHLPKTGNVYLRAYEITHDTPLTAGSLKQETLRHFTASAGQDDTQQYQSKFTIYEGDWGQPYAARFEVWLMPADRSPEVKLKEKNFIIEGWMR